MDELIKRALAAEAERRRTIVAGDVAGLADILGDDLVHIHTLGTQDTKQSYLSGISERLEFKAIDRPHLDCRVYGTVVVMTGPLTNTIRKRGDTDWITVDAVATQVWDCSNGQCRQVSFHATRTPKP